MKLSERLPDYIKAGAVSPALKDAIAALEQQNADLRAALAEAGKDTERLLLLASLLRTTDLWQALYPACFDPSHLECLRSALDDAARARTEREGEEG